MTNHLENLIDNAGTEVRTSKVEQPLHTTICGKCRGTGKFFGRNGLCLGPCFPCKGTGKFTFKTSPDQRAKARASRIQRKVDTEEASIEAFKAAYPTEYSWLLVASPNFGFATDMLANIRQWGHLTPNQLAVCTRCAEKNVIENHAKQTAAPAVDTAGIDRLKLAFDKAREFAAAKAPGLRLRNPKITIGGITISPAKAESKNPGALYVKEGSVYVGKIADGKFFAANTNGHEIAGKVQAFIADPAEAAKVYGQETGICCVCNATLKSKWRLRGIGPICATKFGW